MQFAKLGAFFFIQWMGFATWMVPLTLVLNAHGLQVIQPFAFATIAIGAILSPLFFGALADRKMGPTPVLRGLCLATAATMGLSTAAIKLGWNPWLVLALIQVFALFVTPTVSLATTIAMSQLEDPRRQFGPIRATGTIGWIAGCLLISAIKADASTLAGFVGTGIFILLFGLTYMLPNVVPPPSAQRLTIRERLGWDALVLLRHPDHRTVFLVGMLFVVPLASFYPYTPPQLQDLGFERAAAWMSLGQTTEILAMFGLGTLLAHLRLKWILGAGLAFGLVRYLFSALNTPGWVLISIALHGFTYTLYFTTAQIYVNERIDAAWRARAQALLSLMIAGIGNLVGYLGGGAWFRFNSTGAGTNWPLFWGVLAGLIAGVAAYFLAVYRGRHGGGEP